MQSLPIQDAPEGLRQLVYDWDMRLIMNDERLQTIEQVRQFLEGSEAVELRDLTVKEKYYWIEEVLIRFRYHRLKRDEKGVIRRYVGKVTGYSRWQLFSGSAFMLIIMSNGAGLIKTDTNVTSPSPQATPRQLGLPHREPQ